MPTINKIEVAGTIYDLEDTFSENKFVALTGDQTVAGTKTFTDDTILQDAQLNIKSTNITDGTVPSTNIYDNSIFFKDSNNDTVGLVRGPFYSDGKQAVQISSVMPVKNNRNNSTIYNALTLGLNTDGTRYIAVTETEPWRKALLLDCVLPDYTQYKTLATGGSIYFGSGVGNSTTTYGSTGNPYGVISATNSNDIYIGISTDGTAYDTATTKTQWNFASGDTNPYIRYRTWDGSTWSSWISPYFHSQTSRTANTVLAAPNNSDGQATFRALVAADIPNLNASKITTGTLPIARGGTGAATADLAWSALGGGSIGKLNSLSASNIPSTLNDTTFNGMVNINSDNITATSIGANQVAGSGSHYLRFTDSNDNALGYVRSSVEGANATGATRLTLAAYRSSVINTSGSNITHAVHLTITRGGGCYVTFSDPSAWRKGLDLEGWESDITLTGTNAITAESGYTISYPVLRIMGQICQLNFTFKAATASSTAVRIGTLKTTDYAPKNTAYGCGWAPDYYGVYIDSDGAIYARKTSTSAISASITYVRQ